MTSAAIPKLQWAAFEVARELEHGWVGTEHFLLALLRRPSVATDVVAELGLTAERLEEYLRTRSGDPDHPFPAYDPQKGLSGPNPAGHALVGWAQGLAAAWGRPEPAPEDWLIAMVYGGGVPPLLRHLDVTQAAVLDALRAHDVRVPDVEPRWHKPWRGHHRVDVTEAQLGPVLQLLKERHPPGSEWRWSFNWISGEPRRARVDSEEGIDLDALVAEVEAVSS